MACRYHTLYERLTIPVCNQLKVSLLAPCCQYPVKDSLFFQERRFMKDGALDLALYERAVSDFCRTRCPEYKEGIRPITDIIAGTWRKCPLRCLTCFNHYENNMDEPILSASEMDDYLFSLGELGRMAALHNAALNAPGPLFQIGGSGDIFHSENYRAMLSRNLPEYGISPVYIITNMQFWTPRNIACIHEGTGAALRRITFSVDSANPELYEKIRKGSSWRRLMYSYMNCTRAFPRADYHISYTVSTLNFHEFEKAPALLKEWFPKVSTIFINAARDWARRPETAALVLPPAKRKELFEWCAAHSVQDGYRIAYWAA